MTAKTTIESLCPARPIDSQVAVEALNLELPDGYATSVFRYRHAGAGGAPDRSPTMLPVLYMHGIQSHPGWFSASACHLAQLGHTVYQVTRRGSGANTQARGDVACAGQLLDDVASACRLVRSDSGCGRTHLLGVSWGGKLLAAFLAARPSPEAASLTLVSPGLASRVDVSLGRKLAIVWALRFDPARLFDIPLNDASLFTADPRMQDYLRGDRLRLHKATARLLWASRRLDRIIAEAVCGRIGVASTLILAEGDRIIDNARTRRLAGHLTAGRARVVQLPGQHTLEFEPAPREFFDAIAEGMSEAEKGGGQAIGTGQ